MTTLALTPDQADALESVLEERLDALRRSLADRHNWPNYEGRAADSAEQRALMDVRDQLLRPVRRSA